MALEHNTYTLKLKLKTEKVHTAQMQHKVKKLNDSLNKRWWQ